jgi:diguanylate cyclase (GGDEF)-like protein
MSRLNAWWIQPDQFDWITTFLREHGWLRPAQKIIAVVGISAALVPLTVLTSHRKLGVGVLVVGAFIAVYAIGFAAFWLTSWPTRRQSAVAAIIGTLCVGGWSLAQPSAAIAALTCTATAVTGGYIAFFHSPRVLVLHSLVTAAIATTAVLRLFRQADLITATAAFWLLNFLNVSVPLAIYGMSRVIGVYAQLSAEDPLTGLLNRRAFIDAVTYRLGTPPPGHTHLAVAMVDLDNFKRINDTHGHSVGDRALRAVAKLLREHAPADAIICRAGGEEFLIALTCMTSEIRALSARICTAVASLSLAVTASIGTVSAELNLLAGRDCASRVEQLITIADEAMYSAKRSGGNQASHSVCT